MQWFMAQGMGTSTKAEGIQRAQEAEHPYAYPCRTGTPNRTRTNKRVGATREWSSINKQNKDNKTNDTYERVSPLKTTRFLSCKE